MKSSIWAPVMFAAAGSLGVKPNLATKEASKAALAGEPAAVKSLIGLTSVLVPENRYSPLTLVLRIEVSCWMVVWPVDWVRLLELSPDDAVVRADRKVCATPESWPSDVCVDASLAVTSPFESTITFSR